MKVGDIMILNEVSDAQQTTESVRRCGACMQEMTRRYKESPAKFKGRKYCSPQCAATVCSARFSSKKRGGDK